VTIHMEPTPNPQPPRWQEQTSLTPSASTNPLEQKPTHTLPTMTKDHMLKEAHTARTMADETEILRRAQAWNKTLAGKWCNGLFVDQYDPYSPELLLAYAAAIDALLAEQLHTPNPP